jgi:dipeptidyl aminopeptidase/acylaminoacyl peptidase
MVGVEGKVALLGGLEIASETVPVASLEDRGQHGRPEASSLPLWIGSESSEVVMGRLWMSRLYELDKSEGRRDAPAQDQERGKLRYRVAKPRRTHPRWHPQGRRSAFLGGVSESSAHICVAKLQLEEPEHVALASPLIGEHVIHHRVVEEGPLERRSDGGYFLLRHEVSL